MQRQRDSAKHHAAPGADTGLAGFAILFFGRVAREERMMLETPGDSYRAYTARTGRVFLPIFLK